MKQFLTYQQGRITVPLRPSGARLAGLALAALAAFTAAVNLNAAETPGAFALKDAKVVRVSGPVLDQGTVIVRNGLIEAVGANITIPADAWIIDCKGLTIYPGMIDAFSTIGIPAAAASNAANAAGRGRGAAANPAALLAAATEPVARGPEDRPSNESYVKAVDQVSPADPRIESARNGGFLTAVTFPTGKIFNGNGSVIDLAGDKPGQMVVADAVGQSISIQSRGGYGRSYPGSLMGYIAYVRQIYIDADRYKTAKAIYEKHPEGLQRPAYDRTLEGVLASPRILLPAGRAPEIERMANFAKELKQPAILYGLMEGYREVDFLKKANMPVIVSLKWPAKAMDTDPANVESLRVLENEAKAPTTPGLLAKAGVKFAFYSDSLPTPKEMLAAVKKSIDAGLAPADAIRALTLTPAEFFGVSNRVGSVDKGKIANLVVADGDIFAPATKLKYVFVDGMKFEVPADTTPARGGFGGRGGAPSTGPNAAGDHAAGSNAQGVIQ